MTGRVSAGTATIGWMKRGYDIRIDGLTGPGVVGLLREHLRFVALHSPAESIHALDPAALQGDSSVTFWGVWDGGQAVGCGALVAISPEHGEVKSMVTAEGHRRRGVATAMLDHLLSVARERGYRRLSLETGAQAAYAPARALYKRYGFVRCPPFGGYLADPNSVFMTRALA